DVIGFSSMNVAVRPDDCRPGQLIRRIARSSDPDDIPDDMRMAKTARGLRATQRPAGSGAHCTGTRQPAQARLCSQSAPTTANALFRARLFARQTPAPARQFANAAHAPGSYAANS